MHERTRTIAWNDPLITVSAGMHASGLDYLRAIASGRVPQPPISATLGFELVEADEGLARFRGVPAEYHYNPMGTVHGGFACTLLDSAMSSAVMTVLDADTMYTTAQLAVHLTRPITEATGPVIAEGKLVNRGARIATAEGRLCDLNGKLLAHGTTTCLLMPRRELRPHGT